jgi:hypothetical protein
MYFEAPKLYRNIGEDKWNYGIYILNQNNLDSLVVEIKCDWKYMLKRKNNTFIRQIFYKNQLIN